MWETGPRGDDSVLYSGVYKESYPHVLYSGVCKESYPHILYSGVRKESYPHILLSCHRSYIGIIGIKQ